MSTRIHSKRPPPQVGVNSNTGRITTVKKTGLPPMIRGRVMGALGPALQALGNQSVAPVCPVTRSEMPPAQRGIRVPAIPKATDLDSAIKAINQLIDLINTDSEPSIRWLEKERTTNIVRITNPEDDSQWVDVERIERLVMEDQETGDLWVWELGQSAPPAPSAQQILNNLDKFKYMTLTVVTPPQDL
jgi:hypothetical protein